MPIPDFQTLMLPFLELTADGEEHTAAELREPLADRYQLTEEERQQKLPSGAAKLFNNRVAWAKIHLERAGLIENTRRGVFRIADAGRRILSEGHDRINLKFLNQFEGHRDFQGLNAESDHQPNDTVDEQTSTPEEVLESAYQQIKDDLAEQLLMQIRTSSPAFFERLVVELMLQMGYGGATEEAGVVTPLTADEGIDGVINQDALGLEVIYLQAKRWENPVGSPEIQRFVGALHGKRAKKGVFITTSTFTKEARRYVLTIEPKVVLIDGKKLAELMIQFDLGVSTVQTFSVKKVDLDYFIEE